MEIGHSVSLTTSKALCELTLEGEQALKIYYLLLLELDGVQRGQLICLGSHSKRILGSRISLSLRYLIYQVKGKVGKLQRLEEIRDVEMSSS